MEATPVVDPAALERLHGLGGTKLVRQIVRLYLENVDERIRQIDEGLAPGGEVARSEAGAHSLKSSAANVGALRVSALCADMERVAARGEVETLRALREALGGAVTDARDRLEKIVEEEYG